MPNFNPGTDQGTLQSHPLYHSPFNEVAGGPYKITYNGFVRINTGNYPNDETGDSALTAWHHYLQNLDITISKHDCSTEATAGSVVMRDADGNITGTGFRADTIYLGGVNGLQAVVSGGRF
jgi:hypothetical protein